MRRQIKAKPAGSQPCGVTSATARRILQSLESMSSPLAVSTHIRTQQHSLCSLDCNSGLTHTHYIISVSALLYLCMIFFFSSSTGCQENPSSSLIPYVTSKCIWHTIYIIIICLQGCHFVMSCFRIWSPDIVHCVCNPGFFMERCKI